MSEALYGRGLYVAVNTAYASFPITNVLPGQRAIDNSGNVWEWTGKDGAALTSWSNISTNSASHVTDSGPFLSENCANVSVGTTAASQDLNSATRSVTVTNYHATQGLWIGLGTTTEAAADIVGTTGSEIGAYVPPAGGSRQIAVHSSRTRLAYIGSGAATTINVAQSI